MPISILMPALSPTMTEGGLARWLKNEGDTVKSGDVLAEIETDKATMEYEAVDEGTLGRILVPAGSQGVPVNQPIALLLADGEDAAALASAATPVPAPKPAAPPAKAEPVAVAPPPPAAPAPAAKAPAAPAQTAPVPVAAHPVNGGGRSFASPLARRLAKEAGLDLARVIGSGPHGRIVKSDIEQAVASGSARPAVAAAAPPAGAAYEDVALSSMRKTIARRMTKSKTTVPHFYLTIDCTIDRLLAVRSEINAQLPDAKISVNDFIVRAVALALRKVPAANSSFVDNMARTYRDVDVSVAVATPGGLITPIVRQADTKSLATISAEMKGLAARARDGKLKPEEYQGGSITISNLGMYGVRSFSAIINPPQACILAIGAGEQRPVVRDGQIAIATLMTCTLAVDHRIVDGAIGAEYLAAFKGLIEAPLLMMV